MGRRVEAAGGVVNANDTVRGVYIFYLLANTEKRVLVSVTV